MLSCEVCGYETGAKESAYPGWAKDTKTGKNRYFIGGSPVTGALVLPDGTYSFDQDALAYQGTYELNGEQCEFDSGRFVRCTTADVVDAGLCGQTVYYVFYRNGRFAVGGSGAMNDYEFRGVTPIRKHNGQIKQIIIGKDITYIGKFNFNWCSKLQSVTFEEETSWSESAGVPLATAAFPPSPFPILLRRSMAMRSTIAPS